jgi:pimeloyl-ACP methyl ester carboxylesterase
MASITPFKISISEDKVKRLQQKLALTDFPSEVPDPSNPWSRGVPLSEIKRLAFYWQHHFDWRAVEVNIEVAGFDKYDIHFVHQRSQITDAIPLLFLHGWPSSFLEVAHMLPLLVDGGNDGLVFHVVAPSLIDFGFSSSSKKVHFFFPHSDNADTSKKGFNVEQHAEAYHKLMLSLGYNEYGIPLLLMQFQVLTP